MWHLPRWGCAAAIGLLVLTACTTTTSIKGTPATPGTRAASGVVDAVPFTLYTHCGIHELAYEGKYYERVGGSLDDGHGNPPSGWGNPEQRGVLVVRASTAVFSDAKGHRETFALRSGATSFETICS